MYGIVPYNIQRNLVHRYCTIKYCTYDVVLIIIFYYFLCHRYHTIGNNIRYGMVYIP